MNCRSVSREWHRSWPPGPSSRAPSGSVVLVVAVEIVLWSPSEPSLGPLLEKLHWDGKNGTLRIKC